MINIIMPSLVWGCLIHPYDYFIIITLVLGLAIGLGVGYWLGKHWR